MQKQLLRIVGLFLFSIQILEAQENISLPITSGFNADVIANGTGSAVNSTTVGVDAVNYCFMSADFQPTAATPPAYALPVNGTIANGSTPAVGYQLGSYSGNNSLRLANLNNSGTLVFGTQLSATKLYVLITGGSGAPTVTASIQFSDNTTQVVTNNIAPDWFNSNALPIVISGIGRVNRTNNAIENPAGNPRLYQLTLNVLPANQAKLITGIQFTKTSSAEGVFNAFAVTAESLPSCPQPVNVSATTTVDSGTVAWNAAPVVPSAGYDYYFSTTNTPPTASISPTGNVAATQNSILFSDLITGTTYYCWVRSRCSATSQSTWSLVSFTTGQIEITYTTDDLPTLYNMDVTTGSATSCPGVLSINIPVGYQISAVATSYQMTAQAGGYQSEQRSLLFCTTTNLGETNISNGPAVNTSGTASYNRTNLNIADGATGLVTFHLRTWRSWGGADCNTTYNKVDNNTWKIVITLEAAVAPCEAPEAPTAENVAFCGSATIGDLVAVGLDNAIINWYATATSNEILSTTTAVTTGTYYVSQTVDDCESDRAIMEVTVTPVPAAPTLADLSFCGYTTIADLLSVIDTAGTLQWYESLDAATNLTEDTEIETGTYYVSQTIEGCESERTMVNVTVSPIPTAPTLTDLSFCGNTTIEDLLSIIDTAGTLQWYESLDAAINLSEVTELTTDTYYVSQTIEGCESERTAVEVTINEIPTLPDAAAQNFCGSATVADLEVNAETTGTIAWYASLDDTTPMAENDNLETGVYYVAQTVAGCESDWLAVEVIVNETTSAPTYAGSLVFESGATLSNIEVVFLDNVEIQWYVMNENNELVAIDETTLIVEMTYYVSQTLNGCESELLAIEVESVLSTLDFDQTFVQIYPNPVANYLFITNIEQIEKIAIVNLLGQTIVEMNAVSAASLDVRTLQSGAYLMQLQLTNATTQSIRFIKQ